MLLDNYYLFPNKKIKKIIIILLIFILKWLLSIINISINIDLNNIKLFP